MIALTCKLGCLLATSCTSISWADRDGVVHHLGLVWGREDALSQGRRAVLGSLGLDLRLNGPDSGYSIGWKSQELIAPARRTASADQLAAEVHVELQGPGTGAADTGDWRFLYFSENVSARATLATASCVGLEFRAGPVAPGFTVGWHRGWQLLGDALRDDVVHVHWVDSARRRTDSATLWTIARPREDETSDEERRQR